MPYAHNGDTMLYWVEQGGGSPILLIPGLGVTSAGWAQVMTGLTPSHRVLAVDPRGAGKSDCPDIPYTGEIVANDMAAVLDAAGINSAHVVGLSMGGMIAQEFAIRFPHRIRSLLLLSTYAHTDPWTKRVWEVRKTMIEQIGLMDQFRLGVMFIFSPRTFREMPEKIEQIENALTDNPPNVKGYLRQIGFCISHDARGRLDRITVPAIVMVGTEDILTSVFQGRDLAASIPTADFREIPRASHGLWVENPSVVIETIEELVAAAPERAS